MKDYKQLSIKYRDKAYSNKKNKKDKKVKR